MSSLQHFSQPAIERQVVNIALSIVTNSKLFSDGLFSLLQAYIGVQLVGVYSGEPDSFALSANPPGHVILVDAKIGRIATTERIRRWRKLSSPPFIVVLELTDDPETIVSLIEAGASGYALQGASAAEVAQIIYEVRLGIVQCAPNVTAHLFDRLASLSATSVSGRVTLTPREMDILHHIAKGLSNKQIAEILVIEVRTVKHHVHNILDKLRVQHRWEAARLAEEQGWLQIS